MASPTGKLEDLLETVAVFFLWVSEAAPVLQDVETDAMRSEKGQTAVLVALISKDGVKVGFEDGALPWARLTRHVRRNRRRVRR